MDNFAPDAPNVWDAIAQGVHANAATQGASSFVASKSVLTLVKIIAILTIPASLAVYLITKNNTVLPTNTITPSPINIQNKIIIDSLKVALPATLKLEKMTGGKSAQTATYKHSQPLIKSIETGINYNNVQPLINDEITTTLNTELKNTKPLTIELTPNLSEVNDVDSVVFIEPEMVNNLLDNNIGSIKDFPNVFSPNNDGINDKYVINIEGEKLYNLKIYNENNELLFESNDKNNNWDGINQRNGQLCVAGTYYGVLVYKVSNEGKSKTIMTQIKLIR